MHTPPARLITAAVTIGLLAAACGGTDDSGPAPATTDAATAADQLAVAVASYDLAVGEDQRFIAGVLTPDRRLIAGGSVEMEFFFLGEEQAGGEPEPVATTSATFLPVPGKEPSEGDGPTIIDDPAAAGVYETQVSFDRAGFWGVGVTAEMSDGETRRGTTSFGVASAHQVPAVGDPAPASRNLTLESDAPPVAIDSRAGTEGEIPDPELHDTTIADAIAAGSPTVVVISTPVYCVSRFCGPITDAVSDLAQTYADRAAFVHIEVWSDFETSTLNDAAAEWILTDDGGAEPWVFLIGSDGRIAARWDNVLDRAELEQLLEALPAA
ncbi:MAG: hypothetical protein KY469_19845 [Actinobacteria bacterium]|nr:hypothetical protein [Actinomycetota bacterium]